MEWLNFDELSKKVEEEQKMWDTKVYIDGDYLVLNIEYEYNIALNRIDTEEKVFQWVLHLLEKTWVTREMLWYMMRLLQRRFGIPSKKCF